MLSRKVAMIISPFVSGTGVASIALLLQLYITKTNRLPCDDCIGKLPVESVYTVPHFYRLLPFHRTSDLAPPSPGVGESQQKFLPPL